MDGAQSESEKKPQVFSGSEFMDRKKNTPFTKINRLKQPLDWRVQSLSLWGGFYSAWMWFVVRTIYSAILAGYNF